MQNHHPEEIIQFRNIIDRYDIYFIDLWGVIHNGVKLYDNATKVLLELKKENKKIILISNAPRTNKTVKLFLKKLGFDLSLTDLLITSGDVTRNYIIQNNNKVFHHLGPSKDQDLFENIKNIKSNSDEASEIICTGLIDHVGENISDYKNLFDNWIREKKLFICANPDEVVSRGNKLEFCAGALAKYYHKLGGKVKYFGKPFNQIYELAKLEIENLTNKNFNKESILAIGDNLKTDICGAQNYNVDSLLILNGIYKDFFRDANLNFDKLLKSNEMESLTIKKFQQELKW